MAAVTNLGSTFTTTAGSKNVVATPALGALIVVMASFSDSTEVTPPTDNNADGSGTYTRVRAQVRRSSADSIEVWVRNSLIGSASSTTFTHATTLDTGGGLLVYAVSGVSTAGLAAVRSSGGESNIPVSNIPAPVLKDNAGNTIAALTTNPLVGMVNGGVNPQAITPPASWTEVLDTGYAVPTEGIEVVSRDSGETNSTITWGSTNTAAQHSSIVVEIEASPYSAQVGTQPQGTPFRILMGKRPIGPPLVDYGVASPNATINAPLATATADALVPVVKVALAPTTVTATADAIVPVVKVAPVSPLATATAAALAPTVSTGSSVTAPLSTATADALVPVPKVAPVSPLATGTADAVVPVVRIAPVSPLATATAAALVPVVTVGSNATVNAPLATATADAFVPVPTVAIAAPLATATAAALVPVVKIAPVSLLATATADALVPTLVPGFAVVGGEPLYFAQAPARLRLDASVYVPLATAMAVAMVPALLAENNRRKLDEEALLALGAL